ncbi:retrovirus-related pol polyprotein from transposon TNT 1-94 [Tanacetum coccineum]
MANLSSCDSDVLSEVPYSDTYLNDMINQDVQEMLYFEQTHIVDFPDNEITSDSNINPYSQYLQESQDAVIHDTTSAPNDLLVLSLVEQMTNHVPNLDKENQTNKMENESLTAELERYKERVAIFEQRLNFAAFQQEIDTLKQNLSNHVKEKESLSTTLTVFKKESKYMDKKIVLENQNKELENILFSAKQAFWLKHSNYNPDTSFKPHTPVRIEAPSELPKVSLVNESLKKLKYHLASFDKVVKKRTTSDVISAEVQTIFNQMEAAVDQCYIDKNAFEFQIKQISIDNDQLLNQIMSQEIMHIAVNYVDILDVNKSCVDECNKCLELETELLKKKDLIEKDKDNSCENQNAPTFNQLFEINELKAQSQEKDTVIRKFKDKIKSLSGKDSVKNVKKDIDEIETINIELEHSVAKLLSENENLRKEREHLKSIYKDQFDSIKKTHVQFKEHCDSIIAQINAKSVENLDLNSQLQEKFFAIAALKNELRKLKGKNIVDTAISKSIATIALGIFKLDIEPISHRLENNRDAHEVYLEKTIENTNTFRELVECSRKQNASEPLLESACMFTKHVQELLVYVSKTCPSLTKPCEKLVDVTPRNKDKIVRFVKLVTSSSNVSKQTDSLKIKDPSKPLLTSTGVNTTTSDSGSKPSGNTKKNRISRQPSSNQKNKVKEHPRKVKSSLNKANSVSEFISIAHVKHSVRNAKFESICAICNKCLFDANHDMCLIDYVNDVNVRLKSKSKRNKIRKVWKPTSKVFTEIRYSWKPTGRIFTIVRNRCPLTKITSTKEVPLKESTITPIITPSPELKVVQIVLWYLDSRCSKHMTENHSQLINFISKVLGTVRLGNDHIAKIMGYGDNQMGNVTISRLSHLNFDYITSLAKQGLVRGLPKLKYQKDHLCSACALGKSKKHSHKPKAEDSIQEKLYLLHMDLCGPMRIQSINGRKYILVIVNDYSRFTWVKFLRSKDEVPEFVIKFLKMIQVRLNANVPNITTDNGTEFNGIVERWNHTLVEAAHTMLIFSKALKPDLYYLHIFGALCYPTNDGEDLGKLKPKADIGIFVGYAPANSGPGPKFMTPGTISSGLVQNIPSLTPYDPPIKNDWETLFQPISDEYLNPSPCVDPQVPAVFAP